MNKQEELITFLQHIGDDCVPDGVDDDYKDFHIECSMSEDEEGCCPKHGNCGICRYEYMKSKGWLSEDIS
jgi:hypothetical protein